jgi:predicted ATPase
MLPLAAGEQLPAKTLLIESLWRYAYFAPGPETLLSDIAVYDFDPKLPKKAVAITGKRDLDEDGSNLSIVLQDIFANSSQKRKFSNLIRDLIPFVANLYVENFADRSLLFKISETFDPRSYFPASLVSDGTIHITALVTALYFQSQNVVVIEEPEHNIHPYLISRIVQMLNEAANDRQVIITTYNPEVVKHALLDSLILVSRDEGGFSTLSRPSDHSAVRTFLEHELGVDDLYVQNLLGV